MTNYPNMSYCQCQNTLQSLFQVMQSMEGGGVEFVKDMGREERRAYQELYHACEAFMRDADILEQDLVEEFEKKQAQA